MFTMPHGLVASVLEQNSNHFYMTVDSATFISLRDIH